MSASATEHAEVSPARPSGWPTPARLERIAWLVLGAAMATALALLLWFGRDTTYSIDEFVWFATSPGLDLEGALTPHAGHLILTSRLVYKGVLETLGAGYEPFRILTGAAVLLTAGLFFAYASRRVSKLVALAPTLVLLVFGSDSLHVLAGNGFTVLLAISCGLGALLALDRGGRRGDAVACGLLCLGVLTYTVALAFVVGVAVSVLVREDRWRRIWTAVVPVGLYAIWWLWALSREGSSDNEVALTNIFLIPAWCFQALAAALGAVTGLDYSFSSAGSSVAGACAVLALALIVVVAWRLARDHMPATLWVAIAIAVSLWAMQAIAPNIFRTPETPRYLYPGAVAALLIAVEAASWVRWTGAGLIALYAVAAIGVTTNVIELRDEGRDLREIQARQARTDLGALELAAERTGPASDPGVTDSSSELEVPFGTVVRRDGPPPGAYLEAAASYGSLGYSPEQIRTQSEIDRARADTLLAGELSVGLAPSEPASADRCRRIAAEPGQSVAFTLPPEGVLMRSVLATGPVEIRRFASRTGVPLGGLAPDQPAVLRVPADAAPDPWQVSVPVDSLRVCTLA